MSASLPGPFGVTATLSVIGDGAIVGALFTAVLAPIGPALGVPSIVATRAVLDATGADPVGCAPAKMNPFLADHLGTMLLVLFGDGVVANVLLSRSKAQKGDWIVSTAGWACGVTIAVYAVNALSGAHLRPAVTIGLASIGKFEWARVPGYIVAQTAGAFLGGVLVWLTYLPHWPLTEDKGAKLAVFCTGPAVRRPFANLLSEAIATAALVIGLLSVLTPKNLVPNLRFETGFAPLLVGVIVFAIGLSLGGSTGYAINPARDLGPRLAHLLLPIPGKGTSDWGYAWVPVIGPIIGGVVGAWVYVALWTA